MDIQASHSSTSFACSVARQLRDNTRELAKQATIKAFCSMLAAELANVQQYLEDLCGGSGKAAGETRLLKLLDNLERLCMWPSRSDSPQYLSNTFDRRRYPALIRLVAKRQVVKKAIKDFASDPRAKKHRESLLKLLGAFEKREKVSSDSELSELGPVEIRQQQDYQAYIRVLYASLASHCLCLREDDQKVIKAHLRLNSCCTPGEFDDSINFRVFFLDHPHGYGPDGTCQWQDTQICVLRKRGIKLVNEQGSDNSAHLGQAISRETFCKIITNRKRSQLKLAISDDGLVLQGPGCLSQDFLHRASSISLAKLLDIAKLSRKMRLLLSYFLAKAFWQFYDSEWMQTEWTKETVHFMFERRSEIPKGIYINEPFLSARFGCQQSRSVEDEFRSHLFPKILALGIMFLEIELGIKIEEYRMPEDLGPDGEPTVNADHIAAMEVLSKIELWQDTFRALRDVIGACLTPDHFNPFLNDVQGLRAALEKHIVSPLQALYGTAWEDPDTSCIRAITLDSSGVSLPGATEETAHHMSPSSVPLSRQLPVNPTNQTVYYSPATHLGATVHAPFYHPMQSTVPSSPESFPGATMSTSNLGFTANHWFGELDKLNRVLRSRPNEQDSTYQPLKIAILDTGVNEDYVDLVKEFKDFVRQDTDTCQDNTGHGTSAVLLIMKVYNKADIYVGRVFEDSRATDKTAALMAEAIRHATICWKVDIIVMPSGFQSEDSEMESSIDEARNAGILIFAAASNYGNLFSIAFPGRLYIDLKLFCMFSTDANARALPNFNPSPSSRARHNFAILGDNIILPNLEKPLSGTSFATMIGGSVAARILDFSRQHKDNREKIRHIDKLHTVEGMSAVFESMVESAVDNRYHCMSPWKILPINIKGEEPKQKRLRERAHICETISRALEDMHRR